MTRLRFGAEAAKVDRGLAVAPLLTFWPRPGADARDGAEDFFGEVGWRSEISSAPTTATGDEDVRFGLRINVPVTMISPPWP